MPKRSVPGEGLAPHKWRGRWRAALTIGFDENGQQQRRWVYGKTQAECRAKLNELKRQRDDGTLPTDASMTVSQWFEHWFKVKEKEVSRRTLEEYGYTSRHILARLGRLRLDRLTPLHVQRMQLDVAEQVSARAAVHARGLLFNALDDALKLGLVARNVAAAVDPVKYTKTEFRIWNAQEIIRFLAAAERSPYYALFYLALATGMRSGELIALHWEDVDGPILHVHRSISLVKGKPILGPTKNRKGRTLTMHKDTQAVLEAHREALAADEVTSPLVFPSRTGGFLSHGNILRSLETWAKRADVPVIRVHDLRHTYASMCIAKGTDAVRLSRDLGHADPAFTYSRYGHIFDRYQPREAPSLEELLGVS